MAYYCVELNFNFNSQRLAYILIALGFTVICRSFEIAWAGCIPA